MVKTSGLRWISLMWLANIPWAHRTWALPVLTALAPSEQYHRQIGLPRKRITDRARQMILRLRRWLPTRPIAVVADRNYVALELLNFCQSLTQPVTFITRLRLDAALYEPPPTRLPGQIGRPRIKGQRLSSLIDLLDNDDVNWDRVSVLWHDGTTCTLELGSQTAHWYSWGSPSPCRSDGYSSKTEPTFIDAIALVRRQLWLGSETLSTSVSASDMAKVPLPLFQSSRGISYLRRLMDYTSVQSRG